MSIKLYGTKKQKASNKRGLEALNLSYWIGKFDNIT